MRPKTTHSSNELPASRLPPCRPPVTSPAPNNPGMGRRRKPSDGAVAPLSAGTCVDAVAAVPATPLAASAAPAAPDDEVVPSAAAAPASPAPFSSSAAALVATPPICSTEGVAASGVGCTLSRSTGARSAALTRTHRVMDRRRDAGYIQRCRRRGSPIAAEGVGKRRLSEPVAAGVHACASTRWGCSMAACLASAGSSRGAVKLLTCHHQQQRLRSLAARLRPRQPSRRCRCAPQGQPAQPPL